MAKTNTQFSVEHQNRLFELEDKSWWFKYRASVISRIASEYFDKSSLTLDIGGGNGYTTSQMAKKGFKMGLLEPSYQAFLNGKKRGIELVINGSIEDIETPQIQYTLLDVLEHIKDDDEFLEVIKSRLTENGLLLLTVPAYMSLWSEEDVKAGHFRGHLIRNLGIMYCIICRVGI